MNGVKVSQRHLARTRGLAGNQHTDDISQNDSAQEACDGHLQNVSLPDCERRDDFDCLFSIEPDRDLREAQGCTRLTPVGCLGSDKR